jgi:hypothetical protein
MGKKNCGCSPVNQETKGPDYPMRLNNGNLTSSPRRHAPTTDLDSTPREYRRYVDASGFSHVQADNGLHRRVGSGLRGPLAFVTYLYAMQPIIPGQTRDNYGGFHHPRGIDPQSYAQLWADGPGSQPVNPGGPGKIASNYFVNPGTS